ncbi:hypothetical protein R3Q06_22040 [Rhodococcus erythropolis]|uniref:hypothetical protein n=1 Tax=Rhodococcus erythropolis TaxID=1833 RepID=UPI00294A0BC9|nr:hypothetical protein [Rhodococcus erythropolis]MDV6276183.1 hypothetical protein [Rhodococcus erythropolis]
MGVEVSAGRKTCNGMSRPIDGECTELVTSLISTDKAWPGALRSWNPHTAVVSATKTRKTVRNARVSIIRVTLFGSGTFRTVPPVTGKPDVIGRTRSGRRGKAHAPSA